MTAAAPGTLRKRIDNAHTDCIWALAWAGDRLCSGGLDERVRVFGKGETLEQEYDFEGHTCGVVSLAVDPSQQFVASSAVDSQIRIWDLQTGRLHKTIEAFPVEAWGIAWSPDGRLLASSAKSGNINLWNVESGLREQVLETAGKFTMCVAFAPNGQRVACGAVDGYVHVYDLASGSRVCMIEQHHMCVRSLCFSSDSRELITASDDMHINVHDVDGRLVSTMSGHSSAVLSVASTPTGRFIASGSADHKVKLWDAATRTSVSTFGDHSDSVWAVAFNRSGNLLATAGDDKSVIIYSVV